MGIEDQIIRTVEAPLDGLLGAIEGILMQVRTTELSEDAAVASIGRLVQQSPTDTTEIYQKPWG